MNRSATYRAQCKTWAVAQRLFGITNAGRIDMGRPPSGLMLFRALPGKRDDEALHLRRIVAEEVRLLRAAQRRVAD